MPNFKNIAVLAVAGLALSTSAFAQDADTQPEIQADAETLAQAELIRTPSEEGIVTDAESCEYEGGDIEEYPDGTVCFIRMRSEVGQPADIYQAKIYDGEGLGVFECSGNGEFPNEMSDTADGYCVIYLSERRVLKTRAEVEAEVAAMNQAAMEETSMEETN